MKKTSIKIIFALLLVLGSITTYAQSKLSGDWAINLAKSNFGKAPTYIMPVALTVEFKGDSVAATGRSMDATGNPSSSSAKYSLNGSTISVSLTDGGKRLAMVQWLPNHNGFTKDFTYQTPGDPVKVTRKVKETWTFSDDGKTLTVVQNVDSVTPEIKYTITAVYDRK